MNILKKSGLIKDYAFISLGALILSLGINIFLVPLKISTGGVSGIGTVLYYLFSVPMSVTTLIVNSVLFIFGFRMLEKASVVKTAVGIALLSFFLEATKDFYSYTEDMFISSLVGGILAGLGVGITILRDATTGGSDFAAMMLHRLFPHISVPTFILIMDAFIIFVSGIIFENYTVMLYSAFSLYIGNKVTDTVLVSGDYAKSVLIISDKSREISHSIMTEMQRGVTGIYCKGMYLKNDGIMLMCIIRAKEIPKLMQLSKKIDTDAFITISDVREVCGKGFKGN